MKAKLWTRDFLTVSITNFFLYFIHYLLIASMTVFTMEKFHVSTSMSGLAAGIFIIGMLFGRLYAGRFINKVGWKKMLYIGILFSLAMIVSYMFVASIGVLLIIRLLHGVGFGIASNATGTIVAQLIPDERRGEGTGYYALSTTIAAAIGPFCGILMNAYTDFSMNFIVCIVLILLSFCGALSVRVYPVVQIEEEKKGFNLSQYFEKRAMPIAIVSIFVGVAYSSILSYVNAYAQEINLVAEVSFFFLIYSVSTLVTRPIIGKLFDAKGENVVMYPTMLLFVVGLVVMSYVQDATTLFIAAILAGVGCGAFIPNGQAIAVKMALPHRRGLATSTFFILADFGAGFGPFLLGLIIPSIGYANLYLAMAMLMLLTIVLYYVVHGRKAKRKNIATAVQVEYK